MTTHQAKQDALARLLKHGIAATVRARTVSLQDLARISPVYVYINAHFPTDWKATVFGDLPKPSAGGYIPMAAPGSTCNGKPILT